MAQKKKPRHKRKSHGTKEKATAQKKKPRHKRKSHGTKEKKIGLHRVHVGIL